LEDYSLASKVGRVEDDVFIIHFLPIYLNDFARDCLDHLPRNVTDSWEDLREIFTDNFQGTYVRPGNPWDLKGCRQDLGESLRDYVWHFSGKCHELPSLADADIISAFWDGMTCHTLMHELSREPPRTTKELLDIATRQASGEEAVGKLSSWAT
jgi:hypothetical protein